MMILTRLTLAAGLIGSLTVSALAGEATRFPEPPGFKEAVANSWKKVAPEWQPRLDPDPVQAICNEYRNKPPADVAAKIIDGEKATIVYPADGIIVGDWKKGRDIANNGRGGQFSDDPTLPNGGNCYACHQLEPKEVSFGTLGPSLTGYGKTRGYTPEAARATYAKIYNSQSVLACSAMPRFGSNHVLTPEQIRDAVALLFSPDSPVNQ